MDELGLLPSSYRDTRSAHLGEEKLQGGILKLLTRTLAGWILGRPHRGPPSCLGRSPERVNGVCESGAGGGLVSRCSLLPTYMCTAASTSHPFHVSGPMLVPSLILDSASRLARLARLLHPNSSPSATSRAEGPRAARSLRALRVARSFFTHHHPSSTSNICPSSL